MNNIAKLFVILCVSGLVLAQIHAQTTCHANDNWADHFRGSLTAMMTPEGASLRTKFALPLVDSSQISLVSDPVICARAGQALDSLSTVWAPATHGPHPSTGLLFVYKIGTSYAVIYQNPGSNLDGDVIYFFASSWAYTGVGIT
jgi:hypothetical protein